MIKIRRNCKKIERSCSELMPFHSFSPGCYARYWSTGDTSSLSMSVNVFVERFSPSTNGLVWQLMVVQNFVRGFSSWCEIWPFRTMKKPPCEISQGGFRHLAKCLWNPLFWDVVDVIPLPVLQDILLGFYLCKYLFYPCNQPMKRLLL